MNKEENETWKNKDSDELTPEMKKGIKTGMFIGGCALIAYAAYLVLRYYF